MFSRTVIRVLRQLAHEVLGVLFMLREELETSLQQALELFVLGGEDQRLFERPINGLMVLTETGSRSALRVRRWRSWRRGGLF